MEAIAKFIVHIEKRRREGSFSELMAETAVWFDAPACGLSNPLDGSAHDSIACFKSDGPIGERGLVVLREMRATSKGGDGRNEQSHIFDEEEGIGLTR
uniref:Uncharacterized protein n=1 Tax=Meloidogyne javanica TaxID=6303 RepID=A0A915MMN4_MELJA